jgi:quercetin dioxygenase-like cupin family protein
MLAEMNTNVGTRVLAENDRLRVWDMQVPPGGTMPAHTHELPYFYAVVRPGKMKVGDGQWRPSEGDVEFYDVKQPKSDPAMVNEGDALHREIVVEIKPEPPGGYDRSKIAAGVPFDPADAPPPTVGTKVLFENDRVKVWDLRLAPGEKLGRHIHRVDNFFVILSGGLIRFANPDDESQFNDVQFVDDSVTFVNVPPKGKVDNRLENIGRKTHHNYLVELLR